MIVAETEAEPLTSVSGGLSAAMLSKTAVDPELLAEAIKRMGRDRSKRRSRLVAMTRAYTDYHDLTRAEALTEEHVLGLDALFARVSALAELLNVSGLQSDPSRFEAVCFVACTAPLVDKPEGLWGFQMLDFLGRLSRAEAELARVGIGA